MTTPAQQFQRLDKSPNLDMPTRIKRLKKLKSVIIANTDSIIQALNADYGRRCEAETRIAEAMICTAEINHTIAHMKAWARPKVTSAGIKFLFSKNAIIPQPLGVVGIVAPWNYPFNLAIAPLIAAISAGNKVMIKPSEMTPMTADIIAKVCSEAFLETETIQREGACYNKITDKKITAVVPMHTFGHPCKIDEIAAVCDEYNIALVEDAAESLGSYYKDQHTGTFGKVAAFSFNGNKTITTGGGGMIITDDEALAKHAKHLTTTAKVPHSYEYIHDKIGYNYRLPNLNAALGCAQMEILDVILKSKRELAEQYIDFFSRENMHFVSELEDTKVNYWLNAIILKDKDERDLFLKETNESNVMTRPIWALMNRLDMFKDCQCTDLSNALWLEERVVNIPSGVRL